MREVSLALAAKALGGKPTGKRRSTKSRHVGLPKHMPKPHMPEQLSKHMPKLAAPHLPGHGSEKGSGGAPNDGRVHIRERFVRRVERASDPRTAAEQPHLGALIVPVLGQRLHLEGHVPLPGHAVARPAAQVQPIARHRRFGPRTPLPLAAAVAAVAAARDRRTRLHGGQRHHDRGAR